MWTRELLKTNAKQALRGRYGRSVLICLVLGLLGLDNIGVQIMVQLRDSYQNYTSGYDTSYEQTLSYMFGGSAMLSSGLLGILFTSAIVGIAISLAWSAFVRNPLYVGRARYFMESRQAPAPAATVWSTFRTPYMNVVKAMFLRDLKIFGGTLLLIVPGIYWSYCYVLVPYLLAENPYMDYRRAMDMSKAVMEGEKWNYFVLGLSFFGWRLLCVLTLGIGGFFLDPYIKATNAEFYAAMRSKAFAMGLTGTDELGGFVRHDMP